MSKPSEIIEKLGHHAYIHERLAAGVPATELLALPRTDVLVRGIIAYLDLTIPDLESLIGKTVEGLEKTSASLLEVAKLFKELKG